MPRITYTDDNNRSRTIEATVGDSVMETAVRNGVDGIVAECGGSLSCATCHIYVDEADLPLLGEMREMEDEMLHGTASERRSTSRLSCQVRVTAGLDLHVTTPPTQV